MTFGTMRRPFDQIAATQPRGTLPAFSRQRCAGQKQEPPDTDAAANRERKPQIMVRLPPFDRRQCLQIGEQIAQVVGAHVLVRRVRKRRIRIPFVGKHALAHRRNELRQRPRTDAVVYVGRDVRHAERPERRPQRSASSKQRLLMSAARCVARRAVACKEQRPAVAQIDRIRSDRIAHRLYRVPESRRCDDPERGDRTCDQHDANYSCTLFHSLTPYSVRNVECRPSPSLHASRNDRHSRDDRFRS